MRKNIKFYRNIFSKVAWRPNISKLTGNNNKITRLMLLSAAFAITFGKILHFVFVPCFIDGSGHKSRSTEMYLIRNDS